MSVHRLNKLILCSKFTEYNFKEKNEAGHFSDLPPAVRFWSEPQVAHGLIGTT